MRERFDKQLDDLNIKLIEMGILIENSIKDSISSISETDKVRAESAIEIEELIDSKEREIESMCYNLILQQQPVAGDFRMISTALKMIIDMERIGDQTANIAYLSLESEFAVKQDLSILEVMAKDTSKMVTRAIDAFVRDDKELAMEVIKHDDDIDDMFIKVKKKIVEKIKATEEDAETLVNYLMVAKYYERIGDHATNIAEEVIYSITGSYPDGRV